MAAAFIPGCRVGVRPCVLLDAAVVAVRPRAPTRVLLLHRGATQTRLRAACVAMSPPRLRASKSDGLMLRNNFGCTFWWFYGMITVNTYESSVTQIKLA